jgi:hypothetical protein
VGVRQNFFPWWQSRDSTPDKFFHKHRVERVARAQSFVDRATDRPTDRPDREKKT